MPKVCIVGCGPRGLSAAIVALNYGMEVVLIDNRSLHTWRPPYILPDIVMRSPVTFDLVTYLDNLKEFSLRTFLGRDYFSLDHKDIEACADRCNREEFYSYLEYCFDLIKDKVRLVLGRVSEVGKNYVIAGQKINCDAVIMAVGHSYSDLKCPNWIEKTPLKSKRIADLKAKYPNETVLVVGSGQRAAEAARHFQLNGSNTYLFSKHNWKVKEYPVPSYAEWGSKSALGPYYRSLRDPYTFNYLKKVKEWQPSVTPDVDKDIKNLGVKVLLPSQFEEIRDIFYQITYVHVAAGHTVNIDNVPGAFEKDPYDCKFPLIKDKFMSSIEGVYFTGALASKFDGPRQGSVISAGITAKEIVQDIHDRHLQQYIH